MENKNKPATTLAEPIRPFCIEHDEATREVAIAINTIMQKHSIPSYLMKDILSQALQGIREVASIELQNAKIAYQQQLEEYEKAKSLKQGEGENG